MENDNNIFITIRYRPMICKKGARKSRLEMGYILKLVSWKENKGLQIKNDW